MKPVHCSYMVEAEEKIITFEELLEMARMCIGYEEEYYEGCGQAIFAIMKAAFIAREGTMVFCSKE